MDDALRREIEDLRGLKTKALKDRYRELFGEPSPSSNRVHLFRRIAWRLQAQAYGDLGELVRRRALELADNQELRLRAPLSFWQELERARIASRSERDPRIPPVGTVLRRIYRGQEILVNVQADGFEYRGKKYPALSSIASEVTGTRWNGFTFFGLNPDNGRG